MPKWCEAYKWFWFLVECSFLGPVWVRWDDVDREWIKGKLLKHFLPLGFLVALIVALAWPAPGKYLAKWKVEDFRVVQTINVCTIFFISGLTLKTADIMAAVRAYVGFIYGLIAILILTPCIGFVMNEIPFNTKEFNVGLVVFASVPTTLTSGVTLVGQAGGNTALALMLTVSSNMLGIVTTPYAVSILLSSGNEVKLDSVQLLLKLVLTILVPMMIGKILRELSSHLQAFATSHKVLLGLINNGSLVCVVWQTLSRSQSKLIKQDPLDILQVIGAGVGMHLVYLIWNFGAVSLLRMDEKVRKAVLILSSQKTLPVSVTVISFLSEKVGDLGLVTIPCIVGHISQLFIDAYIVSRWASATQHEEDVGDAKSQALTAGCNEADFGKNQEESV